MKSQTNHCMRFTAWCVVVAALLFLPAPRTSATETLDDIVRDYMRLHGTPGLSVVVIKGDEIVLEGAYGLANVELNVPVSATTVYQIASTTKIFTGVAVMMLVDQGKLDLDEHVTKIIPGLPETWKGVTVYNILTHTSGIPDALDDHGRTIADSADELFEVLAEKPMDFEPGSDWSYNQTGFVLAGEIIRSRTGLSFDEFCRKHIFQPLGMSSTSFGGAGHLIPHRASYYTADARGDLVPYLGGAYPKLTWTGAGLNTSAHDLARFDIALFRGALLSDASRRLMVSPVRLNDGTVFRHRTGTTGYGCGWANIAYPDHPAAGMEGGLTNAYYRFLDDDLAIIVLTNFVDRTPPTRLVDRIAGLFIPDFRNPIARIEQLEALSTDGDDGARALGRQLVKETWSHPALLNRIAWTILTVGPPSHRDIDTALRAAERAAELTHHEDPGVLDTLARAHYEAGNLEEAVRWQHVALEQAQDDRLRDELSSTLKRYVQAMTERNK